MAAGNKKFYNQEILTYFFVQKHLAMKEQSIDSFDRGQGLLYIIL